MNKFGYNDIPEILQVLEEIRFEATDYANGRICFEKFRESLLCARLPGMYVTLTHLGTSLATGYAAKEVIYGVEDCLGYKEDEFDLQKSLSIVREPYRSFMLEYAKLTYQLFNDEQFRKRVTQDSAYRISVVVDHYRHRDPVIVTRTSFILTDSQGKMLPFQINFCYPQAVINDNDLWNIVPIPRIVQGTSEYFNQLLQKLKACASPLIIARIRKMRGKSLLTPAQAEVARHLKEGQTIGQMAELLGKSPSTIKKYNTEIIERVATVFPLLIFTEASHVATYLEKTELLNFL
ncbi:MAG: helix-turn-helix transcriptional regulator [Lewinella sp.]